MKKFIKRLFAGLGIGVGAAIPGVSGAAIAVILKVYEDIIEAVNSLRKKFGWAIKVLLPILIGIIIAVVACVFIFSWAFERCMFLLICIFAGFLIGSLPGIYDNVKGVKPNKKQLTIAIICGVLVITLGILSDVLNFDVVSLFKKHEWYFYLILIPVGIIAAVALTVPGLSGSLILLIIGFYVPLVDYTTKWCKEMFSGTADNVGPLFLMLGCFAIGCLIGIVIVSKIMAKLLANHHNSTYFAIMGFVVASVFVLFFNKQIVDYYKLWNDSSANNFKMSMEIPVGVLLLGIAAFFSYMLVKIMRNKEEIEKKKLNKKKY